VPFPLGDRSGTDQAVFGLEEHLHARWDEVCDPRWNANAQIHEHAGRQFLGDPTRDDRMRLHVDLMRW